jgi:hypothetical protein
VTADDGQRQLAAFSGPAFSTPTLSSIALTASPQNQPARSWRLLKSTSTGEGWGLRFFVKGDGQKTHSRAEKKDHENKSKKIKSGSGANPHNRAAQTHRKRKAQLRQQPQPSRTIACRLTRKRGRRTGHCPHRRC